MASTIRVNPSTLRSKASELRGMNNRFRTQIQTLRSQEISLNSMWDGEANEAFHREFSKDCTQFDKFYNAIVKYVSSLNEIAAQYEKAERTNQNTANQRRA